MLLDRVNRLPPKVSMAVLVIDNDTLLTLEVDVLVPAALENVITSRNAAKVQAKVICEGANGPTSAGADATYRLHPALLDACFHVMASALAETNTGAWMPVEVGALPVVLGGGGVVGDAAAQCQHRRILELGADGVEQRRPIRRCAEKISTFADLQ